MMTFIWPYVFLLLPLPLAIFRFLPKAKQQIMPLYMPQLAEHAFHDLEGQPASNRFKSIMLIAFWISFIIALANPVHYGDPISLPATGRDLMLAVDISGSMQERDMVIEGRRVDRLTATKLVVDDFLSKRQGDRIGLILYGGTAHIQAPLTYDIQTVKTFLNEAQIGFAGDGTAIGDAIGLGIQKLKDRPESHRVIILLSDGVNNTGTAEPLEAANFAKKTHIKIYTIALGHPRSRYPLDEKTLADIAKTTNAAFFRARNSQELLEIYELINKMEPVEQEAEVFRPQRAVFYWPLGFALAFLLLGVISQGITLRSTARNSTPRKQQPEEAN
ncbi:MAG: VWA domain-containing protein [Cellvibrionales bacterium]|nr:VWA domain-containing protein [Cellvibrionales bacterium]